VDATPDRPDEVLELIRAHCDRGLRYYTWALERMPSIREQAPHLNQVRSAALALAHVLAYIEGAKDERTAMLARDGIVERYSALVQDEGWQPPFAPSEG
jgi:phytoene/squalene synthetase